jgi:hypothetical protein
MRWLAYLRPSRSSLRERATPCAWLGRRRTKATALRRAPVTSPKHSNHFRPRHPFRRSASSRWPPPGCTAARPRRRPPCPKTARKPSQGEPLYLLHIFPGQKPRWSRRSPARTAAGSPRDPIASPHFFPGSFARTRGMSVKLKNFPGACAKDKFSNSTCVLLILVNSVANRRKIRKMQTQF